MRARAGHRILRVVSATLPVWALTLGGCSTTEEVRTVVRDATVYDPVMSPPLHVASENARNALTIQAYLTAQKKGVLKGNVDGSGSSYWRPQWDTLRQANGTVLPEEDIRTHNLRWYQPEYSGGVHFDVAWETSALSLGAAFAAHGGTTRVGGLIGLGFFSRDTGAVRVRLDVGIFGQVMDFESRSVTFTTRSTEWWGGSSRANDTAFYFDRSSKSGLGYYGSLIINTAHRSWPVNIFLQLNCVIQPLLSYTPLTRTAVDWVLFLPVETSSGSGEVTTSATFLGITPGIYMEPSPSTVLIAGVRYMVDVSGTLKKPDYVVMPFVQFGLRVGM